MVPAVNTVQRASLAFPVLGMFFYRGSVEARSTADIDIFIAPWTASLLHLLFTTTLSRGRTKRTIRQINDSDCLSWYISACRVFSPECLLAPALGLCVQCNLGQRAHLTPSSQRCIPRSWLCINRGALVSTKHHRLCWGTLVPPTGG